MLGQVNETAVLRASYTHTRRVALYTHHHAPPPHLHTPTQVEQAMAEPEDMREATCFQKSFIVLRACFYFTVSKQANKQANTNEARERCVVCDVPPHE
jgi:hypothetical protein